MTFSIPPLFLPAFICIVFQSVDVAVVVGQSLTMTIPQPNRAIYWPLDTSWPAGEVDMMEAGRFDALNSSQIVSTTFNKLAGAERDYEPGPFGFVNSSTSMNSSSGDDYLLINQIGHKINEFTVAFYFFHGEPQGESKLFRVGTKDGNQILVTTAKGILSVRMKDPNSQMILSQLGYPFTWQFYVFTWNGTWLRSYCDFSTAIFAEVPMLAGELDGEVAIAALSSKVERTAGFFFYDTVLSQVELARLPFVVPDFPTTPWTKRHFHGPKEDQIAAFFPLDVESSLDEMTAGFPPIAQRPYLKADLNGNLYLGTAEDNKWMIEFQPPSVSSSTKLITISFYVYCTRNNPNLVQLISFSHNVEFSVDLANSTTLHISLSNQDRQLTQEVQLAAQSWNFVAFSIDENRHINIYLDGDLVQPKTFYAKSRWPSGDGVSNNQILIGPTQKMVETGVACLAIFFAALSRDEIASMKCNCPATWRRYTVFPLFLTKVCPNENVLEPPFLQKALLYVSFNDDTRFENLANPGEHYGISKAVRPTEGPFGQNGTAYTVDSRSLMVFYDNIRTKMDSLTISFYFRSSQMAIPSDRTVLSILSEISFNEIIAFDLLLSSGQMNVVYQGQIVGKVPGFKDTVWQFVALTYDHLSKTITFYDTNGEPTGTFPNPAVERLATNLPMFSVGPLVPGDAIACLFVDTRVITRLEMSKLECACRTGGHCVISKEETTVVMTGPTTTTTLPTSTKEEPIDVTTRKSAVPSAVTREMTTAEITIRRRKTTTTEEITLPPKPKTTTTEESKDQTEPEPETEPETEPTPDEETTTLRTYPVIKRTSTTKRPKPVGDDTTITVKPSQNQSVSNKYCNRLGIFPLMMTSLLLPAIFQF